MCLPGAASIDCWWPQEVITDDDVDVACANIDAAGGEVELMICHDLPSSRGVVGQADFGLGEEV